MLPKEVGSSGVTIWPADIKSSITKVTCIICKNDVLLEEVTAGSCYADGQQAFACNEHTWNKAAWLRAWAQFIYQQASGDGHGTESLPRRVA